MSGPLVARLRRRELLVHWTLPAAGMLLAAACTSNASPGASNTAPAAASPGSASVPGSALASPATSASPAASPSALVAEGPPPPTISLTPADIAAAKADGTVVGYGVLVDSQWQALNDIVQKDVGISVDNFRGPDAAVTGRLIAEKDGGKNLADFILTDSAYQTTLAEGGYLQKLPDEVISRVPAKWRDPNGYWATFSFFPLTVLYNTQLVSQADAPKTYQDVLDPRWKGKIALSDPVLNITATSWFYWLQQQMGQQASDQWFKALAAQNPTMFPSAQTVSQNVNQGQFSLGFSFLVHVLSVAGPNGNMDYMRQDPFPAADASFAQVSSPAHPAALKVTSDVLLSQEYLQSAGDLGYPVTVAGVNSALPGVNSYNYIHLPDPSPDQLDSFTAYLKGIFAA